MSLNPTVQPVSTQPVTTYRDTLKSGYKACNQVLSKAEYAFNAVDTIPVVGQYTSAARIYFGIAQASSGVLAKGLAKTLLEVESCRKYDKIRQKALEDFDNFSTEQLEHGLLNLGRGFAEFAIGVTCGPLSLLLNSVNLLPDVNFGQIRRYRWVGAPQESIATKIDNVVNAPSEPNWLGLGIFFGR
jgi:hypothetical protein